MPYSHIDILHVHVPISHSYVSLNETAGGSQLYSLGRDVAANWTITSMNPIHWRRNIQVVADWPLEEGVYMWLIMGIFPFSFTSDNQLSHSLMV